MIVPFNVIDFYLIKINLFESCFLIIEFWTFVPHKEVKIMVFMVPTKTPPKGFSHFQILIRRALEVAVVLDLGLGVEWVTAFVRRDPI